MKIVWFSWKDINHPQAGGAELVSYNLMQSLVTKGHSVILITSRYKGSKSEDIIGGVKVQRRGNRYSVYIKSNLLFRKKFINWADTVIDEMNTVPFFSAYSSRSRNILLTYQLAREVWFYQMVFPLSLIGYLFEPLYLKLISHKYNEVITESNSTRDDLVRYGFKESHIHIIRVGIDTPPLKTLQKKNPMTCDVAFLGSMRPMKRTLHAVQAFEHAKNNMPNLRLKIAGDNQGKYAKKVMAHIKKSPYAKDITVLGKVSNEDRLALLANSSAILVTSKKEGWGLIVTEANSQGTPAVAYNVDGLRDSIKDGVTGLLSEDNPISLGNKLVELLQSKQYQNIRQSAWSWSKEMTHENSYLDFSNIILENNGEA